MCGKGGLLGALVGGALAFFSGGASLLAGGSLAAGTAGAAAGAVVGQTTIDEPIAKQKKAVAKAQKEQTELITKQKEQTATQRSRADAQIAARVRAGATADRTKAPTGSRTGTSGIQDAILKLGKTKLGGG